jgi:hypothetical protein
MTPKKFAMVLKRIELSDVDTDLNSRLKFGAIDADLEVRVSLEEAREFDQFHKFGRMRKLYRVTIEEIDWPTDGVST